MDARLALDGGTPVAAEPLRPVWPRVTVDLEKRLIAQAHTALSIYDNSGVVADFEEAFRAYVGAARALATSSGTAALHSIYYAAGFGPGDEVICCDYGFFITAAPLVHLGARPVFVDCERDGTISVAEVEQAITPRTRAIVATHMWGQPARMRELRRVCDRSGILLLEDCSHAHGARIGGDVVGSHGDAAAWSLQARKTLWAGEGGILCTRHDDIYERALLLGHFNARALQDIAPSSPNHRYAFTGVGLKYRAHPLAMALALPQIGTLDQLIEGRQLAASAMIAAFHDVAGMEVLSQSSHDIIHGYYALVVLVDPAKCGFDREHFLRAMRAENIWYTEIPGQMGTMSDHALFADLDPGRDADGAFETSRRITATAVKFFVPAVGIDYPDADNVVKLITEAIHKVGHLLPTHARVGYGTDGASY